MGNVLTHKTRINLIKKDKDHNITNTTKNCVFLI